MIELAITPTLVIGTISGFFKLIDGCTKLYSAYKITSSFGVDWTVASRRLQIQHAILKALSNERICWFQEGESLLDPRSKLSEAVMQQLGLIYSHFERCESLTAKYAARESEQKAELNKISSNTSSEETPKPLKLGTDDHETTEPKKLKAPRFKKMFSRKVKESPKHTESPAKDTVLVTAAPTRVFLLDSGIGTETGTPSARSTSSAAISPQEMHLVNQELEELSRQGADAQKQTSLWKKIKWADHDRETLFAEIGNIERGVKQLQDLLQQRGPLDPSAILGPINEAALAQQQKSTAAARDAMMRLHEALIASTSDQKQINFSVRVTEDPIELAAQMAESADYLPLTAGNSSLTTLYAHPSNSPKGPAALLYADTRSYDQLLQTRRGTVQGSDRISDLSSLVDDLVKDHQSVSNSEYRDLGYIHHHRSPDDRHGIFCHTTEMPWNVTRSLGEALADSNFRSHFSAFQKAQVARLATISFLHHCGLPYSTRQYPRIDKFLYYGQANDERLWERVEKSAPPEEESPVLNPYLAIGFGGKPKATTRPIGASSGLHTSRINPVVELGLVLFQVGCGHLLSYGTSVEEVLKALREARKEISQIDTCCGPVFSEVVQLCLDWSKDVRTLQTEEDLRFMERLRSWFFAREIAAH